MSLLDKLFGRGKNQPYVDAGMALTFKLSRSLNLPDWNEGLPDYTEGEIAWIERSFAQLQKLADEEAGGEAKFHPEVLPKVQRMLAGEALAELASRQCLLSDEVPSNWRAIASTYLKAWASRLAPLDLMGLADLLVKAGFKNEARETLQVILLFPTYAKTLWGRDDDELLANILDQAKEALRTLN